MQQMNQNNSYVPNETEFNQMSEILNSSSIGQIDLSNINDDQQTVQQVEPVESVQGPVDPVQGPVDPVQEPVDSVQEPTVQLDSPVS
jgi:hypothetical protein